ncbi:hypothetical protein EJB05_18499 [Eragrostis curvula]|uniref:Bifunctional inhibitor/plant lipid transfer protein/seed storage helical domain-containing protein n=1 Tax=Eragrostis curvula TaxID=38414 RepID=A0A5J9VLU8_9POAL|nr:hypothetical protein EJB05_18499 [Eragrostis curvula]
MATKVIVPLMAAFVALTMLVAHQACAEKDCYHEKVRVIDDCIDFLRKYGSTLRPSFNCRMAVDVSDLACICRILNDTDEEKISAEKLVLLARSEGQALEAGTKCGSYPIPPLPARPPPRAKSMRA